jgi:hypothetical protein
MTLTAFAIDWDAAVEKSGPGQSGKWMQLQRGEQRQLLTTLGEHGTYVAKYIGEQYTDMWDHSQAYYDRRAGYDLVAMLANGTVLETLQTERPSFQKSLEFIKKAVNKAFMLRQ